MNINPSKRMDQFSPAIFGDLKRAATDKAKTGAPIFDLSLGSPDIPPADIVRKTLSDASADAKMYGYTLGGIDRFNEAVADYYMRRSDVVIDPDTEVVQTMGSQEGIVHLPFAFCDKGDIVLTTDPAYVAYDIGIRFAEAESYYMPLIAENNFLPDLKAIPKDILDRAKLLILNLPGNPVPATPTTEYFEEVVAFAKKHHILVLHDAAYSEYYFEGDKPMSFLSTPGAKDVGIEINSLSKSFSLAGARIAYIVGNSDAISIMKQLKSNLDYGTFAPIQEAAIVALNHAEEITDRLRATFSERHHILMNGMKEIGWETTASSGGMFVWAKFPQSMDDIDFVFHVIKEVGVVLVPGSIFGPAGKGFVRIALVQEPEVLKAAVEQLKKLPNA